MKHLSKHIEENLNEGKNDVVGSTISKFEDKAEKLVDQIMTNYEKQPSGEELLPKKIVSQIRKLDFIEDGDSLDVAVGIYLSNALSEITDNLEKLNKILK